MKVDGWLGLHANMGRVASPNSVPGFSVFAEYTLGHVSGSWLFELLDEDVE